MRRLTARNPRTGARDYAFDALDPPEVAALARELRAAQPAWRALAASGRGERLRALANALEVRSGEMIQALEADTGRRRLSRIEIVSVVAALRSWAARAPGVLAATWADGVGAPQIRHRSDPEPYPLVGAVTPWNFPLLLGMIDAAPALAAGCAVLLKPSEIAPRFADVLEAAAQDAGVDGVLRVARGDGETGRAVVAEVDCVAFTGSVRTGRAVGALAAERLIPAFLELGGKDPLIVLEGADLERAVTAAVRSGFVASGQACQSIERVLVAESLHPQFVDRLVQEAEALRLTHPSPEAGDVGPIISEAQAGVLEDQIQDARARGAKVLCGGEVERLGGGLWLRPTVIVEVPEDARLLREETFGPILPVAPFRTEDEAVARANAGDWGLSAAVIGPDLKACERVALRLEAGAVSLMDAGLTALFHEAPKQSFKSSGIGPSRMGPDGLLRFTRRRALIHNTGAPAPLRAFSEDS